MIGFSKNVAVLDGTGPATVNLLQLRKRTPDGSQTFLNFPHETNYEHFKVGISIVAGLVSGENYNSESG